MHGLYTLHGCVTSGIYVCNETVYAVDTTHTSDLWLDENKKHTSIGGLRSRVCVNIRVRC